MVKISDFGLSKMVIDSEEYRQKSDITLAIRWQVLSPLFFLISPFSSLSFDFESYNPCRAAPEFFQDRIFTTKFDVYSFGITVWEVLYSSLPSPFLNRQANVVFDIFSLKIDRYLSTEECPLIG